MTAVLERLSPLEYLRRECKSKTKNEFMDGQVLAMAWASERHNLITTNLITTNLITTNLIVELGSQVRVRPCRVYPSDMRVRIDEAGSYAYPDVTVACGEPLFEDEERDTLLNPTVIVEVLSKSTERYDRGRKFQSYRTLDSLTEYVLVAQDSYHVEHFVRQSNGSWLLSETSGLDREIQLPTIECTLSLAEVYAKVEVDSPANAQSNGQELR